MNERKALEFLNINQPLPSDDDITQEQIDTFNEIRKFLIKNPNPSFIPLMLNAFGNGSGYGVYQVCDDFFRLFSKDEMIPHLLIHYLVLTGV